MYRTVVEKWAKNVYKNYLKINNSKNVTTKIN